MLEVEVRILKNVGPYEADQVVKVSKADAESLCGIRMVHNGTAPVPVRYAMPVEEWEMIKAQPLVRENYTQGELEELGMKNVVETPYDPYFESALVDKSQPPPEAEEGTKAKGKSTKGK